MFFFCIFHIFPDPYIICWEPLVLSYWKYLPESLLLNGEPLPFSTFECLGQDLNLVTDLVPFNHISKLEPQDVILVFSATVVFISCQNHEIAYHYQDGF